MTSTSGGPRWVRHTLANVDGTLTLLEQKTDRSRRLVILPEAVRVELRAHRTRQKMDRLVAGSRWVDSGHVFATMLGRPHHAATISRAFDQALARAELPHTRFHDLRHSAATFLLSQGFGLEDVKNLLGQSTIVLTSNTYGHVLEQRQQEMARGMDAVLGGYGRAPSSVAASQAKVSPLTRGVASSACVPTESRWQRLSASS
jgi:integrase